MRFTDAAASGPLRFVPAPTRTNRGRSDGTDRLGRAELTGHDRVGDGRLRRRVGRSPSTSRRSAPWSPNRSPPSRGTATRRPACIRRRRACSTPSACRGPASSTGSTTSCPTSWRAARPWWRASGAARSTTTAPPPSCSPPRPPRSSPSRSTCRARTSRVGGRSSPTIRICPRRSSRRRPACGRPRWAKLSANTDRIVEVAERRGRAPVPRRSRASTRCSASRTTPRRGGRRSRPAAAGCRAAPSIRSRFARSTTCTRRLPTADHRGRGRGLGVGRRRAAARRCVSGAGRHRLVRRPVRRTGRDVAALSLVPSGCMSQWHSPAPMQIGARQREPHGNTSSVDPRAAHCCSGQGRRSSCCPCRDQGPSEDGLDEPVRGARVDDSERRQAQSRVAARVAARASARSRLARSWKTSGSPTTAGSRASARSRSRHCSINSAMRPCGRMHP